MQVWTLGLVLLLVGQVLAQGRGSRRYQPQPQATSEQENVKLDSRQSERRSPEDAVRQTGRRGESGRHDVATFRSREDTVKQQETARQIPSRTDNRRETARDVQRNDVYKTEPQELVRHQARNPQEQDSRQGRGRFSSRYSESSEVTTKKPSERTGRQRKLEERIPPRTSEEESSTERVFLSRNSNPRQPQRTKSEEQPRFKSRDEPEVTPRTRGKERTSERGRSPVRQPIPTRQDSREDTRSSERPRSPPLDVTTRHRFQSRGNERVTSTATPERRPPRPTRPIPQYNEDSSEILQADSLAAPTRQTNKPSIRQLPSTKPREDFIPRNAKTSGRGSSASDRGSAKGPTLNVKTNTDEVLEEDNYPAVYKQLKKQGKGPQEILARLKSQKSKVQEAESISNNIISPPPRTTPRQDERSDVFISNERIDVSTIPSATANSFSAEEIVVVPLEKPAVLSINSRLEKGNFVRNNRRPLTGGLRTPPVSLKEKKLPAVETLDIQQVYEKVNNKNSARDAQRGKMPGKYGRNNERFDSRAEGTRSKIVQAEQEVILPYPVKEQTRKEKVSLPKLKLGGQEEAAFSRRNDRTEAGLARQKTARYNGLSYPKRKETVNKYAETLSNEELHSLRRAPNRSLFPSRKKEITTEVNFVIRESTEGVTPFTRDEISTEPEIQDSRDEQILTDGKITRRVGTVENEAQSIVNEVPHGRSEEDTSSEISPRDNLKKSSKNTLAPRDSIYSWIIESDNTYTTEKPKFTPRQPKTPKDNQKYSARFVEKSEPFTEIPAGVKPRYELYQRNKNNILSRKVTPTTGPEENSKGSGEEANVANKYFNRPRPAYVPKKAVGKYNTTPLSSIPRSRARKAAENRATGMNASTSNEETGVETNKNENNLSSAQKVVKESHIQKVPNKYKLNVSTKSTIGRRTAGTTEDTTTSSSTDEPATEKESSEEEEETMDSNDEDETNETELGSPDEDAELINGKSADSPNEIEREETTTETAEDEEESDEEYDEEDEEEDENTEGNSEDETDNETKAEKESETEQTNEETTTTQTNNDDEQDDENGKDDDVKTTDAEANNDDEQEDDNEEDDENQTTDAEANNDEEQEDDNGEDDENQTTDSEANNEIRSGDDEGAVTDEDDETTEEAESMTEEVIQEADNEDSTHTTESEDEIADQTTTEDGLNITTDNSGDTVNEEDELENEGTESADIILKGDNDGTETPTDAEENDEAENETPTEDETPDQEVTTENTEDLSENSENKESENEIEESDDEANDLSARSGNADSSADENDEDAEDETTTTAPTTTSITPDTLPPTITKISSKKPPSKKPSPNKAATTAKTDTTLGAPSTTTSVPFNATPEIPITAPTFRTTPVPPTPHFSWGGGCCRSSVIIVTPGSPTPTTHNSRTSLLSSLGFAVEKLSSGSYIAVTTPIPSPNSIPTRKAYPTKLADSRFIYALTPDNKVVRKIVHTTQAPKDVPFIIYGLYPNGTIVRRFPNGTGVPAEMTEANEVIGTIPNPKYTREHLEYLIQRDKSLAYLYPDRYLTTTSRPQLAGTARQGRTQSVVQKISAGTSPIALYIQPSTTTSASSVAMNADLSLRINGGETTPLMEPTTTDVGNVTTTENATTMTESTTTNTTQSTTTTTRATTITSATTTTTSATTTVAATTTAAATTTTAATTTIQATTSATTGASIKKSKKKGRKSKSKKNKTSTTTSTTTQQSTSSTTTTPSMATTPSTTSSTTTTPSTTTTRSTTTTPSTTTTTRTTTTPSTTTTRRTTTTPSTTTTRRTTTTPSTTTTRRTTTTPSTTTTRRTTTTPSTTTTRRTTTTTTRRATTTPSTTTTRRTTTTTTRRTTTTPSTTTTRRTTTTPSTTTTRRTTTTPSTTTTRSSTTSAQTTTTATTRTTNAPATTTKSKKSGKQSTRKSSKKPKSGCTKTECTKPTTTPTTTTTVRLAPPMPAILSTTATPILATTNKVELSTIDSDVRNRLNDIELLNNLLKSEGAATGDIPTRDLAEKVIQLAIERAQQASTVAPFSDNIQALASTTSSISTTNKLGVTGSPNDKTTGGKISVWVVPPGDDSTKKNALSDSDIDRLNHLLSTPGTLDGLSPSEQLIVADLIGSTGSPYTTPRSSKQYPTSPNYPLLQAFFPEGRPGLLGGSSWRNPHYGPADQAGKQVEEEAGLVQSAVNITKAVSQFMSFIIQGAVQNFQSYVSTRTQALARYLSSSPPRS